MQVLLHFQYVPLHHPHPGPTFSGWYLYSTRSFYLACRYLKQCKPIEKFSLWRSMPWRRTLLWCTFCYAIAFSFHSRKIFQRHSGFWLSELEFCRSLAVCVANFIGCVYNSVSCLYISVNGTSVDLLTIFSSSWLKRVSRLPALLPILSGRASFLIYGKHIIDLLTTNTVNQTPFQFGLLEKHLRKAVILIERHRPLCLYSDLVNLHAANQKGNLYIISSTIIYRIDCHIWSVLT